MTVDDHTEIPSEFWVGVEQFNRGDFYACHDTLEAIWMEAMEPDRTFYQGILQIAVGLYHLGNHNWQGCVTLMGEGLQRLHRYQPDYSAIAVSPFVENAQTLLRCLQQAGPDNVETIAHQVYTCYSVEATAMSQAAVTRIDQTLVEAPQGEWRSPVIVRTIEYGDITSI